MKHYKDSIVHGAQLLRFLKGQKISGNELASAVQLPLAATGAAARALRRAAAEEGDDLFGSFALGEDESGDDFISALLGGGSDESGGDGDMFSLLGLGDSFALGEDESGDDFLSAFLGGGSDESGGDGDMFSDLLGLAGGGFMETFEQCGIDVGEMAGKAMGAFFLYGSDFDMTSPESFLSFDKYGPILSVFKDDDENECSNDDMTMLLSASEEYLQCSGMNDFFDPKDIASGVFFDSIEAIEGDCKPVFDMLTNGNIVDLAQDVLDEESAIGELSKICLQNIFGDNPVGNFIRYEYNHIDKTLGCFSKLSEDLPHCVLSIPTQDGTTISFPISLEEKLTCVLGSTYGIFIEEACVDGYESLDKCLPPIGDSTGMNDAASLCADREGLLIGKQDSILGMDASVVTGNKMPDFCAKVFEEKGIDTEEVQSRLEYFNKNRDYGWTIESTAYGVKEQVGAVSVPAISEKQEYESEEISLAANQVHENSEAL